MRVEWGGKERKGEDGKCAKTSFLFKLNSVIVAMSLC